MLRSLAVLLVAAMAAFAVPAAADAAAKKKCKRGYVLKTVKVKKAGKTRRVKRCVKRRAAKPPVTQTPPAQTPPAQTPAPTTPTQTPPAQTPNPTPDQLQRTRDDSAGLASLQSMGGALMLERAEFGASGQTATYYRIWIFADGRMQIYTIDWNSVSGEICNKVVRGTWTLKEGGRISHPTAGTGTYVVLTQSFNGQTGEDLLVFSDTDPTPVWVGPNLVRFEKNPNMFDNC